MPTPTTRSRSWQTEYSLFERSVEAEVLPVAENAAVAHLAFTPEGLDLIGSLLPNGAVGDRYPAPMMPAW